MNEKIGFFSGQGLKNLTRRYMNWKSATLHVEGTSFSPSFIQYYNFIVFYFRINFLSYQNISR